MEAEPVYTCDDEPVLAPEARRVSRLYYRLGFFLLPWFWACNVWLFYPSFTDPSSDPAVRSYVRRSARWFGIYTAAFLAWILTYYVGGPRVLGWSLFDALKIGHFNLLG